MFCFPTGQNEERLFSEEEEESRSLFCKFKTNSSPSLFVCGSHCLRTFPLLLFLLHPVFLRYICLIHFLRLISWNIDKRFSLYRSVSVSLSSPSLSDTFPLCVYDSSAGNICPTEKWICVIQSRSY